MLLTTFWIPQLAFWFQSSRKKKVTFSNVSNKFYGAVIRQTKLSSRLLVAVFWESWQCHQTSRHQVQNLGHHVLLQRETLTDDKWYCHIPAGCLQASHLGLTGAFDPIPYVKTDEGRLSKKNSEADVLRTTLTSYHKPSKTSIIPLLFRQRTWKGRFLPLCPYSFGTC
jgi:hypothetical protein